ncbi:MAG TPA: ATP-binding protein, partial [Puia sp.]|nr:ATP-binding protein [Puia sp.]
ANTRKATFTNLDAGHYVFRVKASDEDGVWSNNEASLSITILPPWWKTPLAYIIYALLTLSLLYFARRLIIQRARTRFALEHERQEARRMHEVDMMKIRFFTNMSHELRTPLSLILAPVEKLLSHARQPEPAKQYQVIHRNARRLLHLVNQLLDFRKLEVNELRLHAQQGDVLQFIRDISFSFIDLAERKNISFHYQAEETSMVTVFDHDKLERILFNLLSNAFKFTPESGSVTVEVQVAQGQLQIKIKDTGIGIAPEMQEKIFERFFQTEVPDTILNQGSGIGLAITMEFVKMHKGTLTVESQVDQGSCFTVTLPFTRTATLPPIIEITPSLPESTDTSAPHLTDT